MNTALPDAFYRIAGYHPCGSRAVRIDMLERLADQIRPMVAWRPDPANPNPPPKGATGDGGFRVTPDMMSILGCSSADVGQVLEMLGFRRERVPLAQTEAVAAAPAASNEAAEAAQSPAEAGEPTPGNDDGSPEPAAATESPVAIATCTAPASEAAPAEAKWDEIWRPRRQGRQSDRPRRRHAAPAGQARVDARPPPRGKEVWRSRRSKPGAPGRREDRAGPYRQSAAPAPKPGIDPDSPFAALSSLKAALERQRQE
jgi:ATP-dependent RNA helicase SUPV3L1/SUV3